MRSSDDLIAFGSRDGVVLYRHGATTRLGTYHFDDPDAAGRSTEAWPSAPAPCTPSPTTPSTPRHYALQVITPRNRPRAHVSVAVSGGPYRYGKKATVTVTLLGHKSTSHLELYAATPDGQLHFLKSGRPDRHGRLSVPLFMSVNATFIGVFDGDAAVAANGVGKRVKVQALVARQAVQRQAPCRSLRALQSPARSWRTASPSAPTRRASASSSAPSSSSAATGATTSRRPARS